MRNEQGEPVVVPRPTLRKPARVLYVDVTRGLLIYWMVVAHALTLTDIGRDSWLFYLRPPGWSTHSFVMLSGFSIATILVGRGLSGAELRHRLGRRAWQLTFVTLGSELASRLLGCVLRGDGWNRVFDPTAPWSISAILLPTIVVFAALAMTAPHFRAPRPLQFILTFLVLGLLVEWLGPVSADLGMGWMHDRRMLGFPILSFVVVGFVGFGLGLLAKPFDQVWFLGGSATLGAVLFALHSRRLATDPLTYMVSTFLLSLGLGGALSSGAAPAFVKYWLALVGRSALLVFVLHRFFLQFGARTLGEALPKGFRFAVLLVVALAILTGICLAKERFARVRDFLRPLGF
jgi:hypothetical protein